VRKGDDLTTFIVSRRYWSLPRLAAENLYLFFYIQRVATAVMTGTLSEAEAI
jgi:hypothetical protein